jgi:hypothetical protein
MWNGGGTRVGPKMAPSRVFGEVRYTSLVGETTRLREPVHFMMSRNQLSLTLDLLLLLAVCALEVVSLTGLPLHEWLGVALCGAVLVHLLLQWTWIESRTRRVLAPLPRIRRTRINYLLNLTLFVAMIVAIFTGVMISETVLPAIGLTGSRNRLWGQFHSLATGVVLLLVGLHLALNWQWVVRIARSFFQSRARSGPPPSPEAQA